MAGPHLECFAVPHHGFGGPGRGGPGKAFTVGLAPHQDGHGQDVDHEVLVDVAEDAQRVAVGVLFVSMGGVAFLPQELRRAQEQPRPEFPADHVGPLVDEHGEVPVALDPLGQERVDDRLARGADHHRLFQFLTAAVGDHGQLGAEAFDVLGLPAEIASGMKRGK